MAAVIPAVAVGVAAGQQAELMFRDALDQLQQGGGNYLRDGQPESIAGKIGLAVGRGYCRLYAGESAQYTGEQAEKLERACRPYLDSLDPTAGASIAAPSSGGRCAVSYRVSFEFRKRVSSPFNCAEFGNWTPVNGANFIFPSGPRTGPITGPTERLIPRANDPNTGDQSFVVQTAQGEAFLNLEGTSIRSYHIPCGPSYEIRNVRFVRVDGLEDDCGPQPPIVVNPRPIADPTPPPFRFNPDPSVDVDIDIDIGPGGDIVFDIGTGPITVNPFGGGGGGDGGGGSGDPGDPTDPGAPGTPTDVPPGGEAEEEAEEGKELVGLLVEVLSDGEDPNKFSNNVKTVYRGIGYVRMGFPGRLGIDISGGTVISPQFFHAQQRGLTAWAVNANLGFSLRTTPYYRDVTE